MYPICLLVGSCYCLCIYFPRSMASAAHTMVWSQRVGVFISEGNDTLVSLVKIDNSSLYCGVSCHGCEKP